MALLLEDPARRIRKKHDDLLGSLETSATEKIAQYRFKLFGAAEPPDATGTARTAEYGVIQGYVDRAGVSTSAASSFGGLYYRTNNERPHPKSLQRWVDLKSSLDLSIPLNFVVSTCDLGGGDPGSPVSQPRRRAHRHHLRWQSGKPPRHLSLHRRTSESRPRSRPRNRKALDKVCEATALLSELGSKQIDLRILILIACAVFVLLGTLLIPYLGIQNDEVAFVSSIYFPRTRLLPPHRPSPAPAHDPVPARRHAQNVSLLAADPQSPAEPWLVRFPMPPSRSPNNFLSLRIRRDRSQPLAALIAALLPRHRRRLSTHHHRRLGTP